MKMITMNPWIPVSCDPEPLKVLHPLVQVQVQVLADGVLRSGL
jgi:hypothetical protein